MGHIVSQLTRLHVLPVRCPTPRMWTGRADHRQTRVSPSPTMVCVSPGYRLELYNGCLGTLRQGIHVALFGLVRVKLVCGPDLYLCRITLPKHTDLGGRRKEFLELFFRHNFSWQNTISHACFACSYKRVSAGFGSGNLVSDSSPC